MNGLTKIFNQISQLKIKSVTDSLFKYGVMIMLIGVVPAIFSDKDWVVIVIFSCSGFILLIGSIFYCFFAIKKPEYLRSESYQLRKQAVELLGDNDKSQNPNVKSVPLIMNPYKQDADNNNENPLLK